MVVAGEHITNDVMGDHPESWKNRIGAARVSCAPSLGWNPRILDIYLRRLDAALGEWAVPGHFYAVGVGPGSPDLLTLRARNIVGSVDVVIAPRAERSPESLALQPVQDLLRGRQVIEHVYPMERDEEKTDACWRAMAVTVAERCRTGQSVAHLTIGDPLLYSTACYLLLHVAELLPPERIHVVPGISAFQAAAAIAGRPLTLQDDRLTLLPATNLTDVERALDHSETVVIYKIGPRARALVELLKRRNLAGHACMVCYAEQGNKERVIFGLDELPEERLGYMSTIIVPVGRRRWNSEKP
jgi:precorrin-2/cobalt-factor-2 C20-methyltransferase